LQGLQQGQKFPRRDGHFAQLEVQEKIDQHGEISDGRLAILPRHSNQALK
jgi:hypothetical protein